MSKLPKKYYSLEETAKGCHCTINDLLHYGETGKLQLCVVLEGAVVEERKSRPVNKKDPLFKIIQGNSAKPVYLEESTGTKNIAGIHPLCEENVLRIKRGKPIDGVEDFNDDCISYCFGLINDDLKFQPIERKIEITDLVITHEEKIRFEATRDIASGDDIGLKERATWLKIIYLLMHELADKKPVLVKTDGLNISQLEMILKKAAKKYDLTSTGLSNSTLNKIYSEAMTELMPHTE